MNVEEELNKIWNNELQDTFTKKIDSIIKKTGDKFQSKLNSFGEDMMKKMDNIFNIAEREKLKRKMNKCRSLDYNKKNNLLNTVLICLANIEEFIFLFIGSEKTNVLKKLNENNKNNYFSLFIELIDNLWMKNNKNDKCDSNKILNQLEKLDNNIFKSKKAAEILSFFLTKLHKEMNFNNNANDINNNRKVNTYIEDEVLKNFIENNEKNQTKISKIFFVNYGIIKTCEQKVPIFIYEQKPIVNLYIQEESKLSIIKKGLFKQLSISENFFFLLNNTNEEIIEYCDICGCDQNHIITNTINNFTNDILIINLDRENDPYRERNIVYPKKLKLKLKDDKTVNFDLISVLKDNFSEENIDLDKRKYKAYCKNFLDEKWYEYGDEENIKLVIDEEEFLDSENALLLIYKKSKNIN